MSQSRAIRVITVAAAPSAKGSRIAGRVIAASLVVAITLIGQYS